MASMIKIDEPEIFALKKNLDYFGEGRDILDSACDCHDGGRSVARTKHSHAIQHTSRLREIETDDPCFQTNVFNFCNLSPWSALADRSEDGHS